jgi:4-hydroxy-2-oxoheptanedioate aldolase
MQAARDRIFNACKKRGIAYLEAASVTNIAERIDEGILVIAGGREETATLGRTHSKRTMPY